MNAKPIPLICLLAAALRASVKTAVGVKKHCRFAVAIAAVLVSVPCLCVAKSGAEHLADINSMFGNEFKGNSRAEEVFKYISQGMDFGTAGGPAQLEKPGSCFLRAIREEFPLFKGKHREFAHWGANGAIPNEVLTDFEEVYPGQAGKFIDRWHRYILTRREAMRQMLGLRRGGARVAQSVFSLVNTKHILGDWTTADPTGLRSMDGLVADIDKSLRTILGRRSDFAQRFAEECAGILKTDGLGSAEKATLIAKKLDGVWPEIKPRLADYGFDGTPKSVDWSSFAKDIDELVERSAKAGRSLLGAEASARLGKLAGGKISSAGSTKPGAKVRGMPQNVKNAAPVTTRFSKLVSKIGTVVYVGLNGYEAWGYQKKYESGLISKQERDRDWTGQAGAGIGGLAGACVGDKIGRELFKADDGDDVGGEIFVRFVLSAIGGIVGGAIGESVAADAYDAVMKTPYEQACKLAEAGDRDAMRFAGEYLWNGKYIPADKNAAFKWWLRKCEKDLADGQVDSQTLERVGRCYATGEGVAKNLSEAMYYLGRSGSVDSKLLMAKLFIKGDHVPQSYPQAVALLDECSRKKNEDAETLLRALYDESFDGWFANDPECTYVLGIFYLFGCEALDIKSNRDMAIMMIEEAAEAGYPAAINRIGLFYASDDYGEQDSALAVQHFQLAAQFGNANGLENYGLHLLAGDGVEKDLRKGLDCLLEAQRMGALNRRDYSKVVLDWGGSECVDLIKKDAERDAKLLWDNFFQLKWFEIYTKLPIELQKNVQDILGAIGEGISDDYWEFIEEKIMELVKKNEPKLLHIIKVSSGIPDQEKRSASVLLKKGCAVVCALTKRNLRDRNVEAILRAQPRKSSTGIAPPGQLGRATIGKDLNRATFVGGELDRMTCVCVDGAWFPEFLIDGLKDLPSLTKEMKIPELGFVAMSCLAVIDSMLDEICKE